MIIFLALVLFFLMIIIGGDRGAVSIMALAGNIIILFFFIGLVQILEGCDDRLIGWSLNGKGHRPRRSN